MNKKDTIVLVGSAITNIYRELISYLELEDKCYEYVDDGFDGKYIKEFYDEKKFVKENIVVGKFKGKDVYKINNKLYLWEEYYTFNTNYRWAFVEISDRGYEQIYRYDNLLKKYLDFKINKA